ncbi:hypothetical protein Vadar_032149 [Vaccinium darrowii]|uniref:Uncharacterized protein n=1 Tax=Vaccinium darrowii TaxID=229202 RepID=A0ACB7YB98_9ERIC|nr:hypothetical protein Vadar_032149 [Vaccinium darrowii]
MAMEEEEKKRKTMTSEGGNYNSRSGDGRLFPPPELPHDWVAAEILTRLPAKSLMRFKCVSKLWLSTILDPGFCEAHRARAGPHCLTGLVIVSPDHHHHRRLLRRRGDDDEEEYPNQQEGLGLGFFLATPSRRDRDVGPGSYVFDLLRHQFTLSTREYDGCDILTLGGEAESWKRLHAAPPIHLIGGGGGGGAEGKENSVYIDGERHWWHSSGCFLAAENMNMNNEYEYEWSKHSLRIPYAFADHGCCLLGNLPPGLMLLTGPSTPIEQLENQDQRQQPEEEEQVNNSESPRKATPPIYSLDLVRYEFDEFVIGGHAFSSTSLVGKDTSKLRIYSYKEDIRPLNRLWTRTMDDQS